MCAIGFIERDLTQSEVDRLQVGFNENAIDHGVVPQDSERIGFVVMDTEKFIGCISGLAYKNGQQFSGWCYLTDLYIEKEYRFQGVGARLLQMFENKLRQLSIFQIWTWTAGYEAPRFYIKQGYEIFVEMENWYSSGDSRIGLLKKLSHRDQTGR